MAIQHSILITLLLLQQSVLTATQQNPQDFQRCSNICGALCCSDTEYCLSIENQARLYVPKTEIPDTPTTDPSGPMTATMVSNATVTKWLTFSQTPYFTQALTVTRMPNVTEYLTLTPTVSIPTEMATSISTVATTSSAPRRSVTQLRGGILGIVVGLVIFICAVLGKV